MMLSQTAISFLLVVHSSLAFIIPAPSTSFLPPSSCQKQTCQPQHRPSNHQAPIRVLQLSAATDKDDEDESSSSSLDDRKGMDNAFNSLNDLNSLDLSDLSTVGGDLPPKITETTISAEAMGDLLQQAGIENVGAEQEVAKMNDMYQELKSDGEEGVYKDIMGEMLDSDDDLSNRVVEDADGIGATQNLPSADEEVLTAVELSTDSDEFMKKALEEAMAEVKKQTPIDPRSDPNSILNDEKLMLELNDVFDKANEQLMESIAEIREEQAELTKEAGARRDDAMKKEEKRLAEAQGSVGRLVDKVKAETAEVEAAMAELEVAQGKLLEDPLMKAADLKGAGIVKQGALVGALLFTLRSVGDLSMMAGPDGASHGVAAAFQGVVALACAAYFFFF